MSGIFGVGEDGSDLTRKAPPLQRVVDWFHGRASTNRREDIHHRLGYGPGDAAPGEDVRALLLGHTVPGFGSQPSMGAPTGSIIAGLWSSPPAGYALLDGAVVPRSGAYAALFGVIGTQYNTGGEDPSEFRLPDARGRVLVMLSSDTEFNTLGKTGGAKTHTLTIAEMPSHNHSQPYIASSGADQSGTNRWRVAAGATMVSDPNLMAHAGGGQAHNNLQPYITVNYAVKL